MKAFFTPLRMILLGIIAITGGLLAIGNYTEVCTLHAVTLNDEPVLDWERQFGFDATQPIYRQPADSLAEALVMTSTVHRFDLQYQFPRTIAIHTNNYTPVCLFLDAATGSVHGVTSAGLIIPLEADAVNWKMPMVVGAPFHGFYNPALDSRVVQMVASLDKISRVSPELYGQLSDIDFSDPDAVTLYFAGANFKVLMAVDQFDTHWQRLANFLQYYGVDYRSLTMLDARFGDMIVAEMIPQDTTGEKPKQNTISKSTARQMTKPETKPATKQTTKPATKATKSSGAKH